MTQRQFDEDTDTLRAVYDQLLLDNGLTSQDVDYAGLQAMLGTKGREFHPLLHKAWGFDLAGKPSWVTAYPSPEIQFDVGLKQGRTDWVALAYCSSGVENPGEGLFVYNRNTQNAVSAMQAPGFRHQLSFINMAPFYASEGLVIGIAGYHLQDSISPTIFYAGMDESLDTMYQFLSRMMK